LQACSATGKSCAKHAIAGYRAHADSPTMGNWCSQQYLVALFDFPSFGFSPFLKVKVCKAHYPTESYNRLRGDDFVHASWHHRQGRRTVFSEAVGKQQHHASRASVAQRAHRRLRVRRRCQLPACRSAPGLDLMDRQSPRPPFAVIALRHQVRAPRYSKRRGLRRKQDMAVHPRAPLGSQSDVTDYIAHFAVSPVQSTLSPASEHMPTRRSSVAPSGMYVAGCRPCSTTTSRSTLRSRRKNQRNSGDFVQSRPAAGKSCAKARYHRLQSPPLSTASDHQKLCQQT